MNLPNITPKNQIEIDILHDITETLKFTDSFKSIIQSELKDDPESYSYTMDDFSQFLFTYNL